MAPTSYSSSPLPPPLVPASLLLGTDFDTCPRQTWNSPPAEQPGLFCILLVVMDMQTYVESKISQD